MLVPSGAVVKQFVQTSLHKLLARVGAALNLAGSYLFLFPRGEYIYKQINLTLWYSILFQVLDNLDKDKNG